MSQEHPPRSLGEYYWFSMETRWLLISKKLCEKTLRFLMCWRTILIPKWRLGDFWCQEWPGWTPKKACAKFLVSEFTARGQSLICLQNVLQGVFGFWVKNDLGNIKAKAKFKDSGCTGEDQSFLSLQSVLQGVLEDIYICGFWMEISWLASSIEDTLWWKMTFDRWLPSMEYNF